MIGEEFARDRAMQAQLLRSALAAGDLDRVNAQAAWALESASLRALQEGYESSLALDRRFAEALGRILSCRGPDVYAYFSDAADITSERATGVNHACGAQLLEVALRCLVLRDGWRSLWICDRCGNVAEGPHGAARLELEPAGPRQVVARLPGARAGAWLVGSLSPLIGVAEPGLPLRWVDASSLRQGIAVPVRTLSPEEGIRRLGIAVVSEARYLIGQLPWPLPDHGPTSTSWSPQP